MHQQSNYRNPKEEDKKKWYEKFFEEIIVDNFPNTKKEIVSQVEEVQTVPYRTQGETCWDRLLIKLAKIKHKESILKAAREKQLVTYNGNPICLTSDLSAETAGQKGMAG